jgi:tetratricopeptide (TPR) repeat protein
LIEKGQPETAVRFLAERVRAGVEPSWSASDKVAVALLHLGRPVEARALWERAPAPPSRAQLLARVATSELAQFDFQNALETYLAALAIDPSLAEAWFGLALLHAQRGDAGPASNAAREGLKHGPTAAQKGFLTAIDALVTPYRDFRLQHAR